MTKERTAKPDQTARKMTFWDLTEPFLGTPGPSLQQDPTRRETESRRGVGVGAQCKGTVVCEGPRVSAWETGSRCCFDSAILNFGRVKGGKKQPIHF